MVECCCRTVETLLESCVYLIKSGTLVFKAKFNVLTKLSAKDSTLSTDELAMVQSGMSKEDE